MVPGIQLIPLLYVIFKHQNLKYQIMLHDSKTISYFGYPGPVLFRYYLFNKIRIVIKCAYSDIKI